MASATRKPAPTDTATDPVPALVSAARVAMATYAGEIAKGGQARIDEAVTGLAWSIYRPDAARRYAEHAVEVTGIGEVESKVIKNQRKTFGTLRDLLRVKSTGIIEEIPEKGLVKWAKPVGVVCAVTPSTNPNATPVNKAMMALKGGNAIIIAPPPTAYAATAASVDGMRAELKKIGLPEDLVQILPAPVTRETTQRLMELSDLVVATGITGERQNRLQERQARARRRPRQRARDHRCVGRSRRCRAQDHASKCFDHATSCSSENAVIIVDAVYDKAIKALQKQGGYMASATSAQRIVERLWVDGKLNRAVIAQGPEALIKVFELGGKAKGCKFVMAEETGIGKAFPLSGEKLSLVLTIYRAKDFKDAKRITTAILDYQGKGHSCGIHTKDMTHAREIAADIDVVRVLVNQAHTFGNGGGYDNALPFTLTMGCGTWQGNAFSDNLNWRNFVNITHLVSTIPEDRPSEEALFGAYWKKFGK